jgi:hypothetical protein
MKKLLLLSLFLTTTLKAQISIGNIFNTDAANLLSISLSNPYRVHLVDQLLVSSKEVDLFL